MLRATHDAALAEVKSQADTATFRAVQAEGQAAYWRQRAELFIDRAAARAGISHEPVMRETTPPSTDPFVNNPMAGAFMTSFDSTKGA
jgi:hypothetical protein